MRIVIDDCCMWKERKKRKVRLIPKLGLIREQTVRPVVKTPQYQSPPTTASKRNLLMAFSMTDSQQCEVTIAPVSKKGNPAPLDGIPVWSTENTNVLALTPSGDGLSCVIAAVGPLTSTPVRVTVTGDADMGSGVTPIVGFVDVEITGGQAVSINVTPGIPTEQP